MAKLPQTFQLYNVSESDLSRYRMLIAEGSGDQAISEFIDKYIRPNVNIFESEIVEILRASLEKEMSTSQILKQEVKIGALSTGIYVIITRGFKSILSEYMKAKRPDLENTEIAKITVRDILNNFDALTKDAMTRTSQNILNNVRRIQRAILVDSISQRLRKGTPLEIEGAGRIFRDELLKRHPEYLELIQSKNFLLSRDNRAMDLNRYVDMSIRTTLLNVDRDVTENEAMIGGDEVVEYYKADQRTIKTKPRIICKSILSPDKKILGKSLLALTYRAADKYGIMTVTEAKSTKDYAMGPYCTHGIRRLPEEFLNKLRKQYGE